MAHHREERAMRVMWLSNTVLSDRDDGNTGSWLGAMARLLAHSGEVALGNISVGRVAESVRQDAGTIRQWVVPYPKKVHRDGLPDAQTVAQISAVVEEFAPDLIHVWGTEHFWGVLTARQLLPRPALLEMQGLKMAIARVYHGGLSWRERLACIGAKEILRRSTIAREQKRFAKWGACEREIIAGHGHIAVQSDWIASQVQAIHGSCRIMRSDLLLREPLYRPMGWRHSGSRRVFCAAAYPLPFKGLHLAIRAAALLKTRFPDIRLRIAGTIQKKGIRLDGYTAWLNRLARHLMIGSNIEWLGPLDASAMITELASADVMLVPSYVENCSTTMQEAMMVGTPVVASYAGGLPSLARDEVSALFFPTGDEAMCAYQLARVITDRALAEGLSTRAREVALVRNAPERIIPRQLEIYRQVLADAGENGR